MKRLNIFLATLSVFISVTFLSNSVALAISPSDVGVPVCSFPVDSAYLGQVASLLVSPPTSMWDADMFGIIATVTTQSGSTYYTPTAGNYLFLVTAQNSAIAIASFNLYPQSDGSMNLDLVQPVGANVSFYRFPIDSAGSITTPYNNHTTFIANNTHLIANVSCVTSATASVTTTSDGLNATPPSNIYHLSTNWPAASPDEGWPVTFGTPTTWAAPSAAVLSSGDGSGLVSTVASYIAANPELFLVLAGIFAVCVVLKLVRSWSFGGFHSSGALGGKAWTWKNPGGTAQFEKMRTDNQRVIAAADREIAKSDRLLGQ